MKKTIQNARFWVYWNDGWVKLTLRPSQEIILSRFCRDDEGWQSLIETYQHDSCNVVAHADFDGADCDGRHRSHNSYFVAIGDLPPAMVRDDFEPLESQYGGGMRLINPVPWDDDESSQRDYAAEAMGY